MSDELFGRRELTGAEVGRRVLAEMPRVEGRVGYLFDLAIRDARGDRLARARETAAEILKALGRIKDVAGAAAGQDIGRLPAELARSVNPACGPLPPSDHCD